MERTSGYGGTMSKSFSLPSLVEGSEPISEADEFMEVNNSAVIVISLPLKFPCKKCVC